MTNKRLVPSWLETAVCYEIYPQTFYDSNGDGIGDIPGIIQKLDYVQSLGVNAIWLNPCFESPFQDAGYDVSDFYKVASRYGTNADLRRLFVETRKHGIRVLLDLVAGHTSVEHPWFKASCKHERNKYTDWFVWTDSVWASFPELPPVRGYGERRGGYIPNFFCCQPALNYGFAHPDPAHPWQQPMTAAGPQAVRQELREIMKFWLDEGASGFRVDMAASLVKGDRDGQAIAQLWQEVRDWLDHDYPEACIVSEWSNPRQAIPAGFHIDFFIHFGATAGAYNSLFRMPYGGHGTHRYGWSVFDRNGHGNVHEFLDLFLQHYEATRGQGCISVPSGNHDIAPRLGWQRAPEDLKVILTFLLTLPGVPFVYYGDEIGMQGVMGLPSKEGSYGREAARTPMQWDASANAGFSTAPADRLYLPVEAEDDRPTVAAQEADPESLLNTVRQLVALRKAHPALCASGDFQPEYVEAGCYPIVYQRVGGGETILVALNPTGAAAEARLPGDLLSLAPAALYGPADAWAREGAEWVLRLPPVSGGVYGV
jgi:maltose alpha-D-glucosyltransferase/alpha-amylase